MKDYLRSEASRQREEVSQWQQRYRSRQKLVNLLGKTVILVDDGGASGVAMKASVKR